MLGIVVVPIVTLWCPSMNPVVGRFGTENELFQATVP